MTGPIRAWFSKKSGAALLGWLAASAVGLALLRPVAGNLAGGMLTALYLVWLGYASDALQRRGCGRWTRLVPQVAIFVLVGLAVFVYPWIDDLRTGALLNSEILGTVVRATFPIALLVVCDHIATAFAQSESGWGRKLAAYLLSLLLLLMPPFAVLLLHRRIVSLSGEATA